MTSKMQHQHDIRTGDREVRPRDWTQLIRCPITGHPCEGDLAYLCPEYGCARKGGLSPRSEENFLTRWSLISLNGASGTSAVENFPCYCSSFSLLCRNRSLLIFTGRFARKLAWMLELLMISS